MRRVRPILVLGLLASAGCGKIAGTRPLNSTAYIETQDGRPRSGVLELRWQRRMVDTMTLDFQPVFHGSPAFDRENDRVYVGTIDHGMYALRGSDGAIVWRFETIDRADAQPTIDRDMLFFGGADGALYALDSRTGQMRWRHPTPAPISRAPLVIDNAVYFVTANDTVYSVNRSDGGFRWRYRREAPEGMTLTGHAGLLRAGSRICTGFSDGFVVCLNANDGSEAWHQSTAADLDVPDERAAAHQVIDVDTTPVVIGNTIYVASFSAGVYALDAEGGRAQWRLPDLTQVDALGSDGRYLYAASSQHGLVKVDSFDGSILWARDLATRGIIAVDAISRDLLTVTTSDRALWVVRTSDGEPVDGIWPGLGFGSAPVIAPGRLYVASNGGVLYSFNLRSPTLWF